MSEQVMIEGLPLELELLVDRTKTDRRIVITRAGVPVATLQALPVSQGSQWQAENSAAITAYNARIEAEGLFGDEHRLF